MVGRRLEGVRIGFVSRVRFGLVVGSSFGWWLVVGRIAVVAVAVLLPLSCCEGSLYIDYGIPWPPGGAGGWIVSIEQMYVESQRLTWIVLG